MISTLTHKKLDEYYGQGSTILQNLEEIDFHLERAKYDIQYRCTERDGRINTETFTQILNDLNNALHHANEVQFEAVTRSDLDPR